MLLMGRWGWHEVTWHNMNLTSWILKRCEYLTYLKSQLANPPLFLKLVPKLGIWWYVKSTLSSSVRTGLLQTFTYKAPLLHKQPPRACPISTSHLTYHHMCNPILFINSERHMQRCWLTCPNSHSYIIDLLLLSLLPIVNHKFIRT